MRKYGPFTCLRGAARQNFGIRACVLQKTENQYDAGQGISINFHLINNLQIFTAEYNKALILGNVPERGGGRSMQTAKVFSFLSILLAVTSSVAMPRTRAPSSTN